MQVWITQGQHPEQPGRPMSAKSIPAKDHAKLLRVILQRRLHAIKAQLRNLK